MNNSELKVSVLMCTNRIDDFFYQSMQSLIDQEFNSFEIILILNGEALGDIEKIRAHYAKDSLIKIFTSSLYGLTYALNTGLEHTSGKYIARMDADDISDKHRLITQYNFLKNNPDIFVCGSNYSLIDENGNLISNVTLPENDKKIKRALFFKNPICHPSVMYRKDFVVSEGGYLGGHYAEDYDLWSRLSLKKVKFHNIQKNLLGYRSNSSGNARGSKLAYASVSASQWKAFILSRNPLWLFGALTSLLKSYLVAKK
jgi:glycosyltransferase involved in cell wall biosynthesis